MVIVLLNWIYIFFITQTVGAAFLKCFTERIISHKNNAGIKIPPPEVFAF